ncbi:sensor domain-containing diguanylate cyclase [Pseudidiomarina atlantica]|uniref:sensor domain-containing diguanylate cyclase n=1 Tax=Pseudidiomarina atlantica TaxID=1517416 RepID=UPI00068C627A|nr:sensor domain-containing diguanylate cyclase [Pseudidiomarina atlantica]
MFDQVTSNQLWNGLPLGCFVLDENGKIVSCNTRMCEILTVTHAEMLGLAFSKLLTPAGRLFYLTHVLPQLQQGALVEEVYLTLAGEQGDSLPVLLCATVFAEANNVYYLCTVMPMHQRNQIEEQLVDLNQRLQHLATTDPLTGLANRRALEEKVNAILKSAKHEQVSIAYVSLDLDYFKSINDTYGHGIGDDVLKEVARVLRATVRDTDFVARSGGEEFTLLLAGINQRTLLFCAERFRSAIEQIKTFQFGITASLGATLVEEDDTLLAIMARADKALYDAKDSGRNCICVREKHFDTKSDCSE